MLELDGPILGEGGDVVIAVGPVIGAILSVFLLTPISLFLIMAGVKMTRLQWYRPSCFASVLAMLPCQPAFILGLPLGAWSLYVLMKSDIRAAFAQAKNGTLGSSAGELSGKPAKPNSV